MSIKTKILSMICLTIIITSITGCDVFDDGTEDTQNNFNYNLPVEINSMPDDIDQYTIYNIINIKPEFYDNKPEGWCFEEQFDNNNFVNEINFCIDSEIKSKKLSKGSDGLYELKIIDENLSECLISQFQKYTEGDYKKFDLIINLDFKIQVLDSSGNSRDFSGLSFKDIENLYPESYKVDNSKIYFKMNLLMDNEIMLSQGISKSKFEIKIHYSDQVDTSKPCSMTSDNYNCLLVNYSDNQWETYDDSSSYSSLSAFKMNNLSSSEDGTYYTDGSIDFILNNWMGTMTYGSDSEHPPVYSAFNEEDEKIDGRLEGCDASFYTKKSYNKPKKFNNIFSIIKNISLIK